MTDESDITEAAESLFRKPTGEVLARAKAIVQRGDGPLLADGLFGKVRGGSDQDRAVQDTMKVLEAIANSDPDLGIYLMTRLCPRARDLYMHNVCDAIELWINANPSKALIALLQRDLLNEPDADMRGRYQDWIALIEARAQNK
jgi:hypothetical protein